MESDKAQHSDRLARVVCMILVAIPLVAVAIFIVSLVLNLYPSTRIFLANENDPADVALAFAYSLPLNEMAQVNSHIVQEKWEFVEKWPEIHEPISKECRFPWDPDFQYRMFGGEDNGGSSSVSLFYTYDCPEYGYWFNMGGLELKLIDGKWQIVRWEEICEERGSGRRCLDSNSFVWHPG